MRREVAEENTLIELMTMVSKPDLSAKSGPSPVSGSSDVIAE